MFCRRIKLISQKKFNMIRMCNSHPGRFGQCCPSIKARQAPRSGCERTARFGGSSGSGKYPKGGGFLAVTKVNAAKRSSSGAACRRHALKSVRPSAGQVSSPERGAPRGDARPLRALRPRNQTGKVPAPSVTPPPFAGTQFPSAFLSARLLDDLRIRRHVTVRRPLEPADLLR